MTEIARKAIEALRTPDHSLAAVPNTVRQSIADVIQSLITPVGDGREVCECPKCGRSHWRLGTPPKAGNDIDRMREALEVVRVGLDQIEATSITDAEIKRVGIAKIDWALRRNPEDMNDGRRWAGWRVSGPLVTGSAGGPVSVNLCAGQFSQGQAQKPAEIQSKHHNRGET